MSAWRSTIRVHPAADVFPLMSAKDLRALADDIAKRGLQNRVHTYTDLATGEEILLDGRNRLDALELLGEAIVDGNGRLLSKLSAGGSSSQFTPGGMADPVALVASLNVHRRHLTAEQKRAAIKALLAMDPTKSNREIARTVKTSHNTVGKTRAEISSTGQSDQLKSPNASERAEAALRENPNRSNVEIAKAIGASDPTVYRVRKRLAEAGEIPARVPSSPVPPAAPPTTAKPNRDLAAKRIVKELVKAVDAATEELAVLTPGELTNPAKFADSLTAQADRLTTFARTFNPAAKDTATK